MQCACAMFSSVACPAPRHFSTLSNKRHDFRKSVIEQKMCALILSITFVTNMSYYKKNSARYDKNIYWGRTDGQLLCGEGRTDSCFVGRDGQTVVVWGGTDRQLLCGEGRTDSCCVGTDGQTVVVWGRTDRQLLCLITTKT
jgi:hypothetical protein